MGVTKPEFARSPEAFEAFYRQYVGDVSRFVARRVDDPYTAADLTADVFVAVIGSAHTYRPERGSLLGWVYGVAHNVVAAERRRAWRESAAGRRIAGRRLLEPADIARLEERIDAESAARRVYRALEGVPESTRRLLELVAVDGLSTAEAAAALGVSPIAARVRLHRARRQLRDLLEESVAFVGTGGGIHGYA
ncbi:RNA polymerase sigma factor [Dactylosporangium sp. NPDC048998]|uniref:RNA polymerase sigma factor n=1 Tax=Dactylosporangium sp. NPDC048998 TaxID=3363976 RepID=UPI003713D4D1